MLEHVEPRPGIAAELVTISKTDGVAHAFRCFTVFVWPMNEEGVASIAFRRKHSITVEELAKKLGAVPEMLALIEAGRIRMHEASDRRMFHTKLAILEEHMARSKSAIASVFIAPEINGRKPRR